MLKYGMPKALTEAIAALRLLERDDQERAAQVLLTWLSGAGDSEFADT